MERVITLSLGGKQHFVAGTVFPMDGRWVPLSGGEQATDSHLICRISTVYSAPRPIGHRAKLPPCATNSKI